MMSTRRILDLFKCANIPIQQHLGRWTKHNYKQTTLKIKYANEDNCGVSGNFKNQSITQVNDIDYI
jgi:hypothetical protein